VTETTVQPTFREKSSTPHTRPEGDGAQVGLRVGGARACVIIPAYDASRTLGRVIEDLLSALPEAHAEEILVVDDGSSDETWLIGRRSGTRVFRQPENLGKGAALVRGLEEARALGYEVALTVDADGQHPASSAREILAASDEPRAIVLAVRNLRSERAPWANRFSNGVSNFFLSSFAHRRFFDTQCGLRRYPVHDTLSLGARARGYAFEAEVLLRAGAAGMPILQKEVRVHYPPEKERVTHFDSLRDPVRIIAAVLGTLCELRFRVERRR
jgi:glycosyltransferase involved in cell wall biosynthesis